MAHRHVAIHGASGICIPDRIVVGISIEVETQRIASVPFVGVLGQEPAGGGVVMTGLQIIQLGDGVIIAYD
jgi:hypothetical protein